MTPGNGGSCVARVVIARIDKGRRLVIEDAEILALDFIRMDPGSRPRGYDHRAGCGDRDRITRRPELVTATARDRPSGSG